MYTVCKKNKIKKIERKRERKRESKRENKRERKIEQGFDCELLTRTVRKRTPTSGTN